MRRTASSRRFARVTAAVLVPLLTLAPSCATRNRAVRLDPEGGRPIDFVVESGGEPIEIPEAELWESFRQAARELVVKPDPLAAAEETFGLAEGSATYRYYARSGLLVPDALPELEEAESTTERMTREYLGWCGGTRMGYGDCLHLLAHSRALTLHGMYVVTLVMSMTASFGPMLDSLKELADPNAVAVMLASAVALYLVLLLVPEPISKLISLGITGALIGYLGLTMFWELVYGARAMARTVDAATDFSQLEGAARDFGKVLGPQMGQLLILLVSHSLGKGLAAKGAATPPRFAEASAQAQRLLRMRLAAVGAARSVTLGAGVITISLASGAMAVGAPSGTDGAARSSQPAARVKLTQDAVNHIVQRHWATSGAPGAGKFAAGTTIEDLRSMIDEAVSTGASRPNSLGRPGQIFEHGFGRQIGIDLAGNPARHLRVVVSPEGEVITAFPF
jgi:hypothetical protein